MICAGLSNMKLQQIFTIFLLLNTTTVIVLWFIKVIQYSTVLLELTNEISEHERIFGQIRYSSLARNPRKGFWVQVAEEEGNMADYSGRRLAIEDANCI